MIKLVKFLFCLGITALAVVSCRTFFEGDKIRFHGEPFFIHRVPLETHDSINFKPFGY